MSEELASRLGEIIGLWRVSNEWLSRIATALEGKNQVQSSPMVKAETLPKISVSETITGEIINITEKAARIQVGNKNAWIPKKCIANLDKIVLEEGKEATIKIQEWFIEKVEWKEGK